MGAEMIAALIAWPKDEQLNWEAGNTVIDYMGADELNEGLDCVCGESDREDLIGMRSEVKGLFEDLRMLIEGGDDREIATWSVQGVKIAIAGGMTWGDDPSDAYSTISNAYWFPSVMAAIGFDMED